MFQVADCTPTFLCPFLCWLFTGIRKYSLCNDGRIFPSVFQQYGKYVSDSNVIILFDCHFLDFKGFQSIVVKTSISIYFSMIFVLVNTLELAAVKTALLVCEQLGLQYMFLIPAMAISASAVFAERFMPETHGLKLEEIRNLFLENSEKVI